MLLKYKIKLWCGAEVMDWQKQGGKSSVCLQSGDSANCAKLSPLDVAPSCPVTVCVQCGLDKPFPEAAEASTAPTVRAGTATNGAPGARHPLIRWRWDSCRRRSCQAGPPQHCPAQRGWTGAPSTGTSPGQCLGAASTASPHCSTPETGKTSHSCCC